MGKSRLTLHANPQQLREHFSLGVTKCRKLGCDVLNRAMPLAQLNAGHGHVFSGGSDGRGETIGVEYSRQCLGAGGDVRARGRKLSGVSRLELCAVFAGELVDGIRTGVFREKAQRGSGQVGIVAFHPRMTDLGENVGAGRPPTATIASGGGFGFFDRAVFGEQVEVTADRRGRQPQARGEVCSGEGTILGDRLPDPVLGARLMTVLCGLGRIGTGRCGAVVY